MRLSNTLLPSAWGLVAALALAGVAGAQTGGDLCSAPDPITGPGPHVMDNTLATPGAPGTCINSGQNLDIWFEWTASFTGVAEVTTCGQAAWDTKLAAYNYVGIGACPAVTDELACNDDACGLQSTITFAVTNGSLYLIRVAGFATGAGTGTFTITNTTPPCVEDALEENDTCATATPMTAGLQINLACYGDVTARDDDWYTTSVPASNSFDLTLTFLHGSGNIDVEVYDACGGTLLTSGTSTTDNEAVVWANVGTTPATVYWKVFGDSAQDCNLYDMDLVIAPPSPCFGLPDDTFEDNDTCATAVALPTGLTTGLVVFDDMTLRDDDWYTISVPNGDQLDITAYFTDATGDIDIEITDQTGGCPGLFLAGSYGVVDNESLSWSNFTGAAVTVALEVWCLGTTYDCNGYDLDVTVALAPPGPCTLPDDSYEENDDCATAVPMADGSYTGLWASAPSTSGGFDGDNDFYSTTVPAGGTINVDIYFSDADCDTDLYIWDPVVQCGNSTTNYLAQGFSVTDDESVSYTNATGADLPVVIEVRVYSAGLEQCIVYDMDILGGTPGVIGTPFCFGDGSDGGLCPCGNLALVGSGEGCLNVTGVGAFITASGTASVSADTLVLTVEQAAPSDFGIFVQNISLAGPNPFYNGLFCLAADGHLVRHYAPPGIQPTVTDPSGMGINAQSMILGDFVGDTVPGATIHYQFWGRDNGGPCAFGANFSAGLSLTWLP